MMNQKIEICKAFNKCASSYESAAKVQGEIGERLFERLDYLKIQPKMVLDLGCGTGVFTQYLKRKYKKATIVSIDLALQMLKQAEKKQTWRNKWFLVNGDMNALPFPENTFDIVFANQVIHWLSPMAPALRELLRVMNKGGCFMFSSLGPDTFKEIKQAWQADAYRHTNDFLDMHDVGDALVSNGFIDPVMDMEEIVLHYPDLPTLLRSLQAQGVRNINEKRNRGLTSRAAWEQFTTSYKSLTLNAKYPVTYEVVYGHAWKGLQLAQQKNGQEVYIPISHIGHVKKD